MTRKELAQLYDLGREIPMLQGRLAGMLVQACGGEAKGEGPANRSGDYAAEVADLVRLLERCRMEYKRLNRYINSVPDSQMRQILWLRFKEGRTWEDVAAALGGKNGGESVRKRVQRFLQKDESCPGMSGRHMVG